MANIKKASRRHHEFMGQTLSGNSMECKGQIYHEAHNLLFFVVDIRFARVVRISCDNHTQRDNL